VTRTGWSANSNSVQRYLSRWVSAFLEDGGLGYTRAHCLLQSGGAPHTALTASLPGIQGKFISVHRSPLSRLNATKPTSGPAAGDDHARWFAASHRAVREMKADGLLAEDTKVRSSKYLNNLIEQDHRNVQK
jgi:hypothetical protein